MTEKLVSDKPRSFPDEDLLDRNQLAERIAATAMSWPHADALSIGVFGPWGSGKTTIMKLVEHSLRQHYNQTSMPSGESRSGEPIIFWWAPWMVGGEEELLREFFAAFAAAMAPVSGSKPVLGAIHEYALALMRLVRPWVRYAAEVGPLLIPLLANANRTEATAAGVVAGVAKVRDVVVATDDLLTEVKETDVRPLSSLKEEVSAQLEKTGRRVIVFIDDFDRLDEVQTRTMLRLVRAVLDFDRVVFIIGADDATVARSLDRENPERGHHYLDKFFQLTYRLSTSSNAHWDSFVLHSLGLDIEGPNSSNTLKSESEENSTGIDRLLTIARGVIGGRPLVATPRQVVRAGNLFKTKWHGFGLCGEVNQFDLAALCCIESSLPHLFSMLADKCNMLVRDWRVERFDPATGRPWSESKGTDLLESFLDAVEEERRPTAKWLLTQLFPILRSARLSDYQATTEDAIQQRVCHSDYCSLYFVGGLPSTLLSDVAVKGIIEQLVGIIEDRVSLRQRVSEMMLPEKRDTFMRTFRRMLLRLPLEHQVSVLRNFSIAEDLVFVETDWQPFSVSPGGHVMGASLNLIDQLPTLQRVSTLQEIVEGYESLEANFEFYSELSWPHPDDQPRVREFGANGWEWCYNRVVKLTPDWLQSTSTQRAGELRLFGRLFWAYTHKSDVPMVKLMLLRLLEDADTIGSFAVGTLIDRGPFSDIARKIVLHEKALQTVKAANLASRFVEAARHQVELMTRSESPTQLPKEIREQVAVLREVIKALESDAPASGSEQ